MPLLGMACLERMGAHRGEGGVAVTMDRERTGRSLVMVRGGGLRRDDLSHAA